MQKTLKNASPSAIPQAALLLGIGGLIPFAVLPVLVAFEDVLPMPDLLRAHATVPALALYAAVILSFMGGVQWGVAMRSVDDRGQAQSWRRYGVSVLPAIAAWFALLLSTRLSLIALATGFVLLLAYDLWTVRQAEVPAWYERLRLGLTTAVVLSLTVTLTVLS